MTFDVPKVTGVVKVNCTSKVIKSNSNCLIDSEITCIVILTKCDDNEHNRYFLLDNDVGRFSSVRKRQRRFLVPIFFCMGTLLVKTSGEKFF